MKDQRIDQRYFIRETICADAVSMDYKAWDEQTLSFVTLTLYRGEALNSPDLINALQMVLPTVLSLRHPAIRTYREFHVEPPLIYSVSDYIPAVPLQNILEQSPAFFNLAQGLGAIRQICLGIEYAHQNNVIHANLTANDILVTSSGEFILSHFSPVVYLPHSSSLFSHIINPIYAAPEVLTGHKPTPASDLYSLAVIIYQLLTKNNFPYDGRRSLATGGPYDRLIEEKETLPPYEMTLFQPNISPKVEKVLLRSLNKDPSQRWESTSVFFSELKQALESTAQSNFSTTQPQSYSFSPLQSYAATSLARPDEVEFRGDKPIPRHKLKSYALYSKLFLIAFVVLFLLGVIGFTLNSSGGKTAGYRLAKEEMPSPVVITTMSLPPPTSSTLFVQSQNQSPAQPRSAEKYQLAALEGTVKYSWEGQIFEIWEGFLELPLQPALRIEVVDGLGALKYNDEIALGIFSDSTVEILYQTADESGALFTIVVERGKFLVNSQKALVQTPAANYQAYTENGIMGIIYSPEEDRFLIHCFGSERCDLYSLSFGIARIGKGSSAAFEQGNLNRYLVDNPANWEPLLSQEIIKISIQDILSTAVNSSDPAGITASPTATKLPLTTLVPTPQQQPEPDGEELDNRNEPYDEPEGGAGTED